MNNYKNFILDFLSSIAIQCSTSVICEKIIQEAGKFTNLQKISPSKILGYMVYHKHKCDIIVIIQDLYLKNFPIYGILFLKDCIPLPEDIDAYYDTRKSTLGHNHQKVTHQQHY